MTPHEFQILIALASRPAHGYAIMQGVEAQTGGSVRIQTGALYRLLRRLLEDGGIREVDPPAGEESPDERRRYYALTESGRTAVVEEAARMRSALAAARAARLVTGEEG